MQVVQKTSSEIWAELRKLVEKTECYKPSKNRAIRWCRDMAQLNIEMPELMGINVRSVQGDVSITFLSGIKEAAVIFDCQAQPNVLLTKKNTGTSWNGDIVDLPITSEELQKVWSYLSG